MKKGDIVKGISDEYNITDRKMTRALVTGVEGEYINIKILDHEQGYQGSVFNVKSTDFEVIGEIKPFDRKEVIELLKNGCKKEILEYDLKGADLGGANLKGADLKGANLGGANLKGADLEGANLKRAYLEGADLRGANLRGADLRGADLRGADLKGANLGGANLEGANLKRAYLEGANLGGANLKGADLEGANLKRAYLEGADLRGANLRGADLRGADLDFSCYPLWCGGLRVKTDKRLACQLAYHLCSMQCNDTEFIKMRNSILGFANQFHRVKECGVLEELVEVKPE